MARPDLHVSKQTELDALGLEEEEEGPSYLADLNKVPDFIDEAPQEMGEVCHVPDLPFIALH
jgi:charged multivesicular body protein 5